MYSLCFTVFIQNMLQAKERMGEKGRGIMEAFSRLLCRKRLQETDSRPEWSLISALIHNHADSKNYKSAC
jgi:hypothetical protein